MPISTSLYGQHEVRRFRAIVGLEMVAGTLTLPLNETAKVNSLSGRPLVVLIKFRLVGHIRTKDDLVAVAPEQGCESQ